MSQYHDTVREELGDILERLQEIYRVSHPDDVLLFATGKQTLTTQDVARATSSLRSQPYPERHYNAYGYNINSGDALFGVLDTKARQGEIDVAYTDAKDQEKQIRFRMNVTFGSRVTSYELQGPDGDFLSHFTKDMIKSALEETLSR